MICNYVGKIIPALQSRCTRFRFAPLARVQIQDRLNHVISSEGYLGLNLFILSVDITKDGIQALLRQSNGDMRRALNILQSAHAAHEFINQEIIYMTTGTPLPIDIEQIVNWLFTADFSAAYASRIMILNSRYSSVANG